MNKPSNRKVTCFGKVIGIIYAFIFSFSSSATAMNNPETLRLENQQLRTQLEQLKKSQENNRTRSIETSNEIVSKLAKKLSAKANVPPTTVANVLDLALKIHKGAGKALSRDEKLIEVNIRISLAETYLTLGQYHSARAQMAQAEIVRRETSVCKDGGKTEACLIPALRNWKNFGRLVLAEQPLTQEKIVSAYRALENNAIEPAASFQDVNKLSLDPNIGDLVMDARFDLFIAFQQAQVQQAKILRALSQLQNNVSLEDAQRRNLLGRALERAETCIKHLKPKKGAKEGALVQRHD